MVEGLLWCEIRDTNVGMHIGKVVVYLGILATELRMDHPCALPDSKTAVNLRESCSYNKGN